VILCDTGPLVAAAVTKQAHYYECVEMFTGLRLAQRELLVLPTVVAEVGFMLEKFGGARAESAFLRALSVGDFVPTELIVRD
jgi:predicted nucleic acid-binding protein